jgi:hypothetical protein
VAPARVNRKVIKKIPKNQEVSQDVVGLVHYRTRY